jgi:hypothetical protein
MEIEAGGGGGDCPSGTLAAISLTRADLESNPGPRGERPATNRLLFFAMQMYLSALHILLGTMGTIVQLYIRVQMIKSFHILPFTNDAVTLNRVL